ncbi:uncharacterized protein LOC115222385 [Octopus sinensis]|uniref:Uncharacterized protein LOC115222385 n=1 Tax=Octopus sinensis TaxID=2607531 RepID=A0A6P7TES8_9MOLL|nr:uncharacterized protein LOC115222385 [Octopus sinensis]
MSWEAWAPHLKQTQSGFEAANECGIYSLQGDPWYSSNEQLSAKTIKDLREMFSSTCDMSSVEFRETKYFKIRVDENIARFKHATKGGLVVGLGNECIIIAECGTESSLLSNSVVSVEYVLTQLNNTQISQ